MTEKGFRIEISAHIKRGQQTRRRRRVPAKKPEATPRSACLLALAYQWERMISCGAVRSYAEIARLNGLSKARIAQICNLALLAPSIQERILRDHWSSVRSHRLRSLAPRPLWQDQYEAWRQQLRTEPPART